MSEAQGAVYWAVVKRNYTRTQAAYSVWRVVHVDGRWFKLYSHGSRGLINERAKLTESAARAAGIPLHNRTFYDDDSELRISER